VQKFILVSFPHVEEYTTPDTPARGLLNVHPKSIHARTRLEAEKYLFRACQGRGMTPIVLRAGVIYGRNVKLLEAAHWLMKKRLMAIWRKPTWIHLLALPDFLNDVEISIEKDLSGIYTICDDQPLLLQEFLDRLAVHWGCPKPWRLPAFSFYAAAFVCETFATIFRTPASLTRDMIRMSMTSVGRRHEPHEARTCTETCLPDSRRGLNNTLSSTGPARFARPYRDGKENYKLFLGWGRSRLLMILSRQH